MVMHKKHLLVYVLLGCKLVQDLMGTLVSDTEAFLMQVQMLGLKALQSLSTKHTTKRQENSSYH